MQSTPQLANGPGMRRELMEVNVSRLVPEAQRIAARAASVYLEHTAPWFVGLLARGSAYMGGYIPGCSEVDFHLYHDPGEAIS
jgi:hypothetical protein